MKTESHYRLAVYMSENIPGLSGPFGRAAFIAGCVGPDVNAFSYLRGFRIRPFYGHNFENSREYISKTFSRLKSSGCRKISDFYRLGKLVHYVTDAFTYPHNRTYTGKIREHVLYEKRLHEKIAASICAKCPYTAYRPYSSGRGIFETHSEYSLQNMSPENDAYWIISVSFSLLRSIDLPSPERDRKFTGKAKRGLHPAGTNQS